MSLLSYFFGNKDKRILKSFSKHVKAINNLEEEFSSLSDDELRNKTLEFKEDLKNGKSLEDIKPYAFAAVRESSKRNIGLRHFDC